MSERLLRILLSDLDTVRVVCASCKKVAEMSMADLAQVRTGLCPFCGATHDPMHTGRNPFAELAQRIEAVKQMAKLAEVEFVLPEKW